MEDLIRRHFPVDAAPKTAEASLDFEKNALHYTAGYIQKKIQQLAHPMKKELLLCVLELMESGGENEDLAESAAWLNTIDCGRLNDLLYILFLAMELALRRHLATSQASDLCTLKATNCSAGALLAIIPEWLRAQPDSYS